MFIKLNGAHLQALRYLLIGVSTVALDFLTLLFLKEVVALTASQAVVINQLFVWGYNFSLNKYWAFKSFSLPYKQFGRYLLLAAGNYLFSVSSMYLFNEHLHYDYRLVRLVAIMVTAGANFFFYKYWIYLD